MIGRSFEVPTSRDAAASAFVVGEAADPIRGLALSNNHQGSCGPSGSGKSVDANSTAAVVGAGAPGDEASSTPTPSIAAPPNAVVMYWRADILGVRPALRCWDMVALLTWAWDRWLEIPRSPALTHLWSVCPAEPDVVSRAPLQTCGESVLRYCKVACNFIY